jgi:hypothetical protein
VRVLEGLEWVVEVYFPGVVDDHGHYDEKLMIFRVGDTEVLLSKRDPEELDLGMVIEEKGVKALLYEALLLSRLCVGTVEAVDLRDSLAGPRSSGHRYAGW